MTQKEAHEKVIFLLSINQFTQVEISELMKTTRQTVNSRVKKGNWRQREINVIETL